MPGGGTDKVARKGQRRWCQFSIATMLIMTAIVAVCLGLWTHSVHRQQQAVQLLQKKGWRITYSYEQDASNSPEPPGPAWVREWLGIDYVEGVGFEGESITDADLATLRDFPRLTVVFIKDATNVTNAGLVHLRDLPKLDGLGLDCSVTDAGMEHLTVLKNLEYLLCKGPPADKPRRELVAVFRYPGEFDREHWTPRDVVYDLDDNYEVSARLDEEALAKAGIEPTTRFTCDPEELRNDRLSNTLDALLHPNGLGWYIGDGELVITTAAIDNEKHAGINRLRAALPKLRGLEYSW